MTTDIHSQFELATSLTKRAFYHAALEVWLQFLSGTDEPDETVASVYDEIGKIYVRLGDDETALDYFESAVSLAQTPWQLSSFQTHVAAVYRRLSDFDRALRLLTQVLRDYGNEVTVRQRGLISLNLGTVQGATGFYREGLDNTYRALRLLEEAGDDAFYPQIYNNLGLFYLELGNFDESERCLLKAIELSSQPYLSALSELSRLYLHSNKLEKGTYFLRKCLSLVWAEMMSYSKEDLSRICYLLSQVAYQTGDFPIAAKLLERAQLFFGQLGMWREWEQMQTVMEQWTNQADTSGAVQTEISAHEMRQFLQLLDVLNGQEFLDDYFSHLMDTRVLYAEALAAYLRLPNTDQKSLIQACRFADYGMTALEFEVIGNPTRSPQSWEQYKRHPELSVMMLETLGLVPSVTDIIAEHHEYFDGSGFPNGKAGTEISICARIFAIVDYYAQQVTIHRKAHSQVIQEIRHQSGSLFDPEIAVAFEDMFST